MSDLSRMAKVVSVAPQLIELEVFDIEAYRQLNSPLKIGSYLEISDTPDEAESLVAIVKSFRIKDSLPENSRVNSPGGEASTEITVPQFVVGLQPVGRLSEGVFSRGANDIAIPPKFIKIASGTILASIYGAKHYEASLSFGTLTQDESVVVNLDGDRFFGKHIGVVGSTGAGKSSTVAAILQEGIRCSKEQQNAGIKNNSHILIFDLHGEYSTAFPEAKVLTAQNIVLPYWLMNSEELEEMFIESNEQNSHNQISQFRTAVIENKKYHNPGISRVSYDDTLYFSLREVITYLRNLNQEMVGKGEGENARPKLTSGDLIDERFPRYFDEPQSFALPSQGKAKVVNGPFHGEFDRFLMRLEAKMNDDRLSFLLDPRLENGSIPKTSDLELVLAEILGYKEEGVNVTIFDLSGVPFEVLSNFVSLVSRLTFTFCVTHKRIHRGSKDSKELPYLMVLEEAHNYISRSEGSRYRSVRKSIERVAKEGRKYGLSLMIVSQRPAEISETIFSQCSNFVSMRLTNPVDQNYVKRLLPDDVSTVTESISSLGQSEALIIGDSVSIPTLMRVNKIRNLPSSSDVRFHTEWKMNWDEDGLEGIAKILARTE